jgi:hypothetical protein
VRGLAEGTGGRVHRRIAPRFGSGVCVWWIYFRHLERAISRSIWERQPYIYSHILCLPDRRWISVEHAIRESGADRFREGTLAPLGRRVYLWALGGGSCTSCTPGNRALRRSGTPGRRRAARGKSASRFLSRSSAMGVLLFCLLVLLVEEERIHRATARERKRSGLRDFDMVRSYWFDFQCSYQ